MAPRRGKMGEMTGTTEPSPEVIYPILGVNEEPIALMQAPIVINGLYLLCIIGFMFAYWKLIKCREKDLIFYLLPFALIFICASTIFNISTGMLLLANPDVRQTYNLMRGFFAMCYYLAKVFLIEVIFATLHNRLGALARGETPKKVALVTYLSRFFVSIMFFVVIVIAGFTIQYSMDSNALYQNRDGVTYQNSILRYQVHWDRITLAYNCMLLAAGLYFTGFSWYLLRRANKQEQHKSEIKVFLAVVSPAMVFNGLFFVIVDSVSFSVRITWPWSFVNLAQTVIDAMTLSCVIAGILWVGFRREKWVPGITEAGTVPHFRDIPLKEQAKK